MIEQTLLKAGIKNIAGVDEAGRGPCAGPLVLASVILKDPLSKALIDIKDSKELTESKHLSICITASTSLIFAKDLR